MTARLFGRVVKVTAYRAELESFLPLPNGIEITDLRVAFEVEKHVGKEPNTAKVTISNCSADTRKFLERRPLFVRVDAGYEDGARHLFAGDLRWGTSKLDGPTWNTELELGDGERAYRHARVSRSYRRGTSVLVALGECAAAMGLELPPDVTASPDLQRQFATGASIQGPARDELTRLLAPYGFGWSIQDGRIQILKDADTRKDRALVISKDTGMIGSPEHAAPDKPGRPAMLIVRHTLYPQVTPGGLISVNARDTKGVFRVERVRHVGDTHGDDWTTEIEAKPTT